MQKNTLSIETLIKILIAFTLSINFIAALFSILPAQDPTMYGILAKKIILSNDWINLIYNNQDWLDKPHFPFWMNALFFKLFGVSSFTYILSGFIFHLIGAYYTYRLGRVLFNRQVALYAVLFYVSAIHLMLSTIDLRAEAFLLGEIMPACYYIWRFFETQHIKIKYLLLAALFTGLAVMTKGIFVLLTIASGFVILQLFQWRENLQHCKKLFLKWSLFLVLSFIFFSPELITLYLQFDLHPEKVVFGQTQVSGIKWFFWDSQLGRFFNTGPIAMSNHTSHWFFFIHTFLWAFSPWTILLIAGFWKAFKEKTPPLIFLLAAFIPTFIMFSATSFQLDHYTNIIIPFAALLSAFYLDKILSQTSKNWVLMVQLVLVFFLILTLLGIEILFIKALPIMVFVFTILAFVAFFYCFHYSTRVNVLVSSTLVVNLVFIVAMFINHTIYTQYDAGYKMAQYFNQKPSLPIFEYNFHLLPLEFQVHNQLPLSHNLEELKQQKTPYYLVVKADDLKTLETKLGKHEIVYETSGVNSLTDPIKILRKSLSKQGMESELIHYKVLKVG